MTNYIIELINKITNSFTIAILYYEYVRNVEVNGQIIHLEENVCDVPPYYSFKTCPFCGNEEIHIVQATVSTTNIENMNTSYIIRCASKSCSARSGFMDSVDEAVELWNMRRADGDLNREENFRLLVKKHKEQHEAKKNESHL